MEAYDGRYHGEGIAQGAQRIGDAQGVVLQHEHPQQRRRQEEQTAYRKLPVDEQAAPELPVPAEGFHPFEGKLQEDLPTGKQETLCYG